MDGSIYIMLNKADGKLYVDKSDGPAVERVEKHLSCDGSKSMMLFGLDACIADFGRKAFDWKVVADGVKSEMELDELYAEWVRAIEEGVPGQIVDSDAIEAVKSWAASSMFTDTEQAVFTEMSDLRVRLRRAERELDATRAMTDALWRKLMRSESSCMTPATQLDSMHRG